MSRRRALALFACAAFLLVGTASAEEGEDKQELTSPAEDFPQSVGVFGSSWNGGGLSYQRWFGRLGLGLTAGGTASPATLYRTDGSSTTSSAFNWGYNVQLDLLYRLYASNFWRWLSGDLFAFATFGHHGDSTAHYVNPNTTIGDGDEYYVNGTFIPTFSAGLGIGYEIVLFRHFSAPIQFGYVVEWPFTMNFSVAGGLRYRY
jgi:hypothetical protein